VPDEFSVSQNYPNPFNPSTVIEFSLPKPTQTRVEIYNILGQRVRELANRYFAAGRHQLTWNGRDSRGKSLASGVYLYRIVADGQAESRKMVLLK
jgi:flagellar hook assembly protein FlgD